MATFPFVLRGFPPDNGSEYINHQLTDMLEKLRIESTKSRSQRTNDNALVESKNTSVVRKHLGYSHIPSRHTQVVSTFLIDVLTPYLNYHRPCFFPEVILDDKSWQHRRHPLDQMNTPYEKLKAIPDTKRFLKPELTFEDLDKQACATTDNQATEQLNQQRTKLFKHIQNKLVRVWDIGRMKAPFPKVHSY